MIGRRTIAATLAVIALSATPPHGCLAAPVDETTFLADLEKAKRLLAAGNATEGMRVTKEALRVHEDKDYARAKRAELEDLVRRLAFRADCPPPDPATLVKGTLKKYVSKTGELKLQYLAGAPTDFEDTKDGDLFFPARFCGPFSIMVRGDRYPRTTAASPQLDFGMEDDPKSRRKQTWTVLPGIPPYDEGSDVVWLPAKLIHYDGEKKTVLAEKETSLAKAGEPWRIEVKVGRSRITATYNAKPIGNASKPDTVFGYARLDVPDWAEIVVEGQVEPSWIQTKIDAIVDAKRTEFEASFRPDQHLPPWLYAAGAVAEAAEPEVDGLAGMSEACRQEVEHVVELLRKDEDRAALEAIAAARANGAPDSVLALLAARAHLGLDEPTEALAEIGRAVAAMPGRLEPLTVKATVLSRLGRDEEALSAWKAAAAIPSADVTFFVVACLSLLTSGRTDAAKAMAEEAARRGRRSEMLDVIGRVLVQASNGPSWPKSFEHRSANYHVVSDIDVETCAKAAEILEESLTLYRSQVRALKPETKRLYKVCLFSGEAGFARYLKDVSLFDRGGHENAAGIYSPLLKQLLVWNSPSRDEMMRTVRHEGFHQYLDRLLPDPPTWFDEGMAVYFEGMKRIGGGELRTDLPRHDDLALLREKGLVPLASFLHVEHKAFYEGSHRSYAQAWLLVHMLRHGTTKHRDLYKALLSRLETSGGEEAVRAVFDEKLVPALDADLRAHLETLSKMK